MTEKTEILSREAINARVAELGRRINHDYQGDDLVIIGVLNGAFIFMADLVRQLDLPLQLDFIRVSSYGSSTTSSGVINMVKDVEIELRGRDVLLVEDIVDTGRTISWLRDHFQGQGASSVKICALIDKAERREVDVDVDYAGFEVPEGFLVGYGLDYAEHHRHYPQVFHLVKK